MKSGDDERDIDGAVRAGSVVGSENEVAAQSRDRRRHLAGGLKSIFWLTARAAGADASAYTHFYRGRPRSRPPPGANPRLSGTGRPAVPSSRPNPAAERRVRDRPRIGVHWQRDRARQVRTGQRPVDLGDFDRALGTLQDAVESQGHVRRIAELWFVAGVVRQRSEARTARADVDVETKRIGARPKIHAAVRDTTIEERVTFAPHVEQTADVEPRASTFHPLPADPPAGELKGRPVVLSA